MPGRGPAAEADSAAGEAEVVAASVVGEVADSAVEEVMAAVEEAVARQILLSL
tara:strand:- start:793 stop:951 length:159 start_codon:yes stop_codon:yes gene_type:complete